MIKTLENFPLAMLADGIISYIQWLFSNPLLTPDEYRWNKDDRQSRIVISGPYSVDNEKPMSSPFIVVERTSFNFANGFIDDVKGGQENVFQEMEKITIANGGLSINIGSQVASEASSLANYVAIQMQADRKGIMSTLGFLRNMHVENVSPETPAFKASEIMRWDVTLSVSASLQMGWITKPLEDNKWEKMSLRAIDHEHKYESTAIISSSTDTLEDLNANFGFELSHSPQLLEQEFQRGWYYVKFKDDVTFYKVAEIINENKLRLVKDMEDGNTIPFKPDESTVNKAYSLLWNSVHLSVNIPTKGE